MLKVIKTVGVSLIGSGAMAKTLAIYYGKGRLPQCQFRYIMSSELGRAREVANLFSYNTMGTDNIEDITRDEETKIVVEASSQKAVRDYALQIIKSKKKLVVMSVGAFSDSSLLKLITETSAENEIGVYIPSGAIGGLDAIRSAMIDEVSSVSLETRKSPQSLGIDNQNEQETLIFEGSAKEAVKLYPNNVNVSAILSIVSLGFEKTKVKIVSDKSVKDNIHTITASGSFGEMKFVLSNRKSPLNPKTSHLAVLSLIRTLKALTEPEYGIRVF